MGTAFLIVFLTVACVFAFGPFVVELWHDWQDHHGGRP
jgi:hypothetical protein